MTRWLWLLAAAVLLGCAATTGTRLTTMPPNAALQAHGSASGSSAAKRRGANRGRSSSDEYIFITNQGVDNSAEIEYFPAGSNGNVAPTGVIFGPNTGLTGYAQGVAVNAGGEIFVAIGDTNTILGFAPGANGDASPNVTISGPNTGLSKPIGATLDAAGNIYVANCSAETVGCPGPKSGQPSIEEFSAGSNGDVAPIRKISGKRSQLIAPFSVAVGGNGDIYVVDSANPPSIPSLIDVFAARANGNVAPRQVVAGMRTGLNQAYGLAVNGSGIFTDTWNGQYLERFGLRENGDASPKAYIKGPNTDLKCCLDGMATAPDGTVYVVDRDDDQTGMQAIQQFPADAHGDVAPLTSISGLNTGFAAPVHVFVGPQP
jgi:sugar lactone lactonase YvrE